jgi:hypothetical protein
MSCRSAGNVRTAPAADPQRKQAPSKHPAIGRTPARPGGAWRNRLQRGAGGCCDVPASSSIHTSECLLQPSTRSERYAYRSPEGSRFVWCGDGEGPPGHSSAPSRASAALEEGRSSRAGPSRPASAVAVLTTYTAIPTPGQAPGDRQRTGRWPRRGRGTRTCTAVAVDSRCGRPESARRCDRGLLQRPRDPLPPRSELGQPTDMGPNRRVVMDARQRGCSRRNHGLEWALRPGGEDQVPPGNARRSVV